MNNKGIGGLTISEIHVNIIRSDIRRHGNNGNVRAYLADANSCRNAIKMRHDDIHQYQIKLVSSTIDFVHSFQTVSLKTC